MSSVLDVEQDRLVQIKSKEDSRKLPKDPAKLGKSELQMVVRKNIGKAPKPMYDFPARPLASTPKPQREQGLRIEDTPVEVPKETHHTTVENLTRAERGTADIDDPVPKVEPCPEPDNECPQKPEPKGRFLRSDLGGPLMANADIEELIIPSSRKEGFHSGQMISRSVSGGLHVGMTMEEVVRGMDVDPALRGMASHMGITFL